MLSVALAVLAGYSVAFLLGGGARRNLTLPDVGAAATATPIVQAALQFEVFGAPDAVAAEASLPAVSEPPAASAAPASQAPSPTTAATATPAPATATPAPATATLAPATATPAPATATSAPATATSAPATATARPATATARPATASPRAATATARPAASARASSAPRSTPTTPAVAAQVFANDTFDSPATGWPVRTEGDWLAGYNNGKYESRLTGDKPAGIAYPMRAEEYRIAIDVEVETGAAGFVFLYSEPSSYYWAGVTADGSFGIERIDGDQVTPVLEWTPDPSVPRDGKPARITIQRQNNLLMVMVGEAHLAHVPIPSGEWENRYGFVLSPRNGTAVARFDNLYGERFE